MTKIRITVDKAVLQRSMLCGTEYDKSPVIKNCAVALAIRDLFPEAQVGNTMIDFNVKYISSTGYLPVEATEFIYRFDNMRNNPENGYSFRKYPLI